MNRGLLGSPNTRQVGPRLLERYSAILSQGSTDAQSLTAKNTWEKINSTATSFVSKSERTIFLVRFWFIWRATDANWCHHFLRSEVDGVANQYVMPDGQASDGLICLSQLSSSSNTGLARPAGGFFLLRGVPPGTHTFAIQSWENNSDLNRAFQSSWVHIEPVGGIPFGRVPGLLGFPLGKRAEGPLGDRWLGSAEDSSTRTYPIANQWDTLSGSRIDFDYDSSMGDLIFSGNVLERAATNNWERLLLRASLDGSQTYTSPTEFDALVRNANQPTNHDKTVLFWFRLSGLADGSHYVELQSQDNGSDVDRRFTYSRVDLHRLMEVG